MGGRAERQTGQGEERAVLELVQGFGGLVGRTQQPEAWATPALPSDWPEGATMLGHRTHLCPDE